MRNWAESILEKLNDELRRGIEVRTDGLLETCRPLIEEINERNQVEAELSKSCLNQAYSNFYAAA